MRINGHDWHFCGLAISFDPREWRWGWARAMDDEDTPVGEMWLCLGPIALMFE